VRHQQSSSVDSRRAFTFIEVIASGAMLAVLLATVGQLIVSIKRNNRAVEHRAMALCTLENSMEEICNLPWHQIDDDAIASVELPKDMQQRWPQAKLAGDVVSSTDPLDAKRISLRLSLGAEPRPHATRLTTWVYRMPNRN
jgi:hypothetical protein